MSAAYSTYRSRFVEDSLATASPARLVTMLYDRLLLDIDRAHAAQLRGDRAAAAPQLLHAQEIVLELRTALAVDAWDGGPGLAALYGYLHSELVRSNVSGDPTLTAGCRSIVAPLHEAWHQAARTVAAPRP